MLNLKFFLPTFEIHLVPPEMEIFLREHLSDLLKESFNKGVDSLLGWVQRSVVSVLLSAVIVTPAGQILNEAD